MENVKYIPGDLVRSNNNPKIIWKVKDVSQDKRGNVLYRLIAVEEEDAFVYLYEPQIASIPLAPAILEANGWIKNPFGEGGFIERYTQNGLTLFIYHTEDDEWICRIGDYDVKIKLVHQLQHLLFGLGLDSSLKV